MSIAKINDKKRLVGVWSEKDIQNRIANLSKELEKKEELSKSRRKLIYTKLAKLRRAEKGECTVGGQLAKHPKTIRSKEKLAAKKKEKKKNRRIHCLCCRGRGHTMQECRKLGTNDTSEKAVVNICFNCGDSNHTLRACKKPLNKDGSLPFAVCFICYEKGHLASQCSKNSTGIYPQGGGCHICNSPNHLKINCPAR